jgi:hypothetical protein
MWARQRFTDEALTGTEVVVDWYAVADRAFDEVVPGATPTPVLDKKLLRQDWLGRLGFVQPITGRTQARVAG